MQDMLDHLYQRPGTAIAQADRFIIWPIVIPIATAIAVASAASFSSLLSFVAPIPGVLVIFGWLIGILVAIVLAAWRHAWRRMASLLAILVFAVPATPISMAAGDYVHFLLALPYYAIKIAASGVQPREIYFHWPSAGFVPSYERNLVYDPSDGLAPSVGRVELSATDPAGKKTVSHFIGHFYLVEEYW
jgi:hypothetical protein